MERSQIAANGFSLTQAAKPAASTGRKIATAAIVVGVLTAIVRLGSAVKELTVAWKFGTAEDLEAFLIAVLVPLAVISITTSSINASFIAAYVQVKEREGEAGAKKFFANVSTIGGGLLVVLTAILIITAPIYLPLIARGYSADKLRHTSKLLYITFPVLIFGGVGAIWSATLNAEKYFVLPAIAPLATPLLTTALLLLLPVWRSRSLVAGLMAGEFIELVILGLALKRLGFSVLPGWPQANSDSRELAFQYLPIFIGSILMALNIGIDQAMAAMLTPGSVASLSYANNLIQFPVLLIATPLAAATLPYFSGLASHGHWQELVNVVRKLIIRTLWFTIPIAAFLFFFPTPVIALLFRRGAFTDNDVREVARVSACYALQIPFYIAALILARMVSALQANRILLWGALIGVALNITLNYLLMKFMGVAGIALSTSFVYMFLAAFSYGLVMKFAKSRFQFK